ncbi:MAG: anhydro-N-acetylmuramic acid kinase [Ginsengibacter sp.]
MVYRVIGLMSGSSLDGLDIAFAELLENAGKWSYKMLCASCDKYTDEMMGQLKDAHHLNALDYQLLHISYGHYIGSRVNNFIEKNNLHHQVHLVVSHGHTTFHLPQKLMTAQLGDGAAIAAETKLPVVTDLRALDVALGGEGAPIVPIGDLLLFSEVDYFLNIGGIANIAARINKEPNDDTMIAFDVCAANRILNMLANEKHLSFDEDGKIAASGNVHLQLLEELNNLSYYNKPWPKSLANNFGTDIVYPLIMSFAISVEDALCTYVEHIAFQIKNAIIKCQLPLAGCKLLITGGGALNKFLIGKIRESLITTGITITVPEDDVVNFKEALIMALIGTLRWREEYNILKSVTGACRNSIGGALWLGNEA